MMRFKCMCIAILLASAPHVVAKHQAKVVVLSDGAMLRSVQGKLVRHVQESTWSFMLKDDVLVGQITLKAGIRFPLLSNAVFEAMQADRSELGHGTYRLWARVTRYRNRNYLFPDRYLFLPDAAARSPEQPIGSAKTQTGVKEAPEPGQGPPEDELIPDFIRAQRRRQPAVQTRRSTTRSLPAPNRIVLDRTGYILQQEDRWVFVYDSLGQNRQTTQFQLLPCALLESMENQQSQNPERLYFKITGIRTLFKGKPYLLLRRAMRFYSHRNFKR